MTSGPLDDHRTANWEGKVGKGVSTMQVRPTASFFPDYFYLRVTKSPVGVRECRPR